MKNRFLLSLFLIFFFVSCNGPLEGSITFLSENNKNITFEFQELEFIIEEDYWDILGIDYDGNFIRLSYCDQDIIPDDLKVTYVDVEDEDCKQISEIEGYYFIIKRVDKNKIKVKIDENASAEGRIMYISLINLDISGTIQIIQESKII